MPSLRARVKVTKTVQSQFKPYAMAQDHGKLASKCNTVSRGMLCRKCVCVSKNVYLAQKDRDDLTGPK